MANYLQDHLNAQLLFKAVGFKVSALGPDDLSPRGDFFACSSLRTTDLRNHIPILSGLERNLQ